MCIKPEQARVKCPTLAANQLSVSCGKVSWSTRRTPGQLLHKVSSLKRFGIWTLAFSSVMHFLNYLNVHFKSAPQGDQTSKLIKLLLIQKTWNNSLVANYFNRKGWVGNLGVKGFDGQTKKCDCWSNHWPLALHETDVYPYEQVRRTSATPENHEPLLIPGTLNSEMENITSAEDVTHSCVTNWTWGSSYKWQTRSQTLTTSRYRAPNLLNSYSCFSDIWSQNVKVQGMQD